MITIYDCRIVYSHEESESFVFTKYEIDNGLVKFVDERTGFELWVNQSNIEKLVIQEIGKLQENEK